MITTHITEMFGLKCPIMSAPMALHSGGTLAAAVSKAGAPGSFGGVHPEKSTDWLLNEIAHIRTMTDGPLAVGFINDFIPVFSKLFDATLEAKPPVIALSFGNPEPWLSRAKAAGAKVMCQSTRCSTRKIVTGPVDPGPTLRVSTCEVGFDDRVHL